MAATGKCYQVHVRETTSSYFVLAENREDAKAQALALYQDDPNHFMAYVVSRYHGPLTTDRSTNENPPRSGK